LKKELGAKRPESLVYKYFDCLSVCLMSVCLYPINVKTAKPIGPNPRFFLFVFDLQLYKEKIFTIEIEDGDDAP